MNQLTMRQRTRLELWLMMFVLFTPYMSVFIGAIVARLLGLI